MDTSHPSYNDILIENAALKITVQELTARNEFLARLVLDLQETVKKLQDEINQLKKQKPRPKIPPSSLENGNKGNLKTNRQTSADRITGPKKVSQEEIIISPPNIPEGSRFKGYSDFHVEELNIEVLKIKYRLAIYESSSGEVLRGRLPPNLRGKHFGPDLVVYCLDQYHARGVTRPQLLEQLHGFGVTISAGELDSLLILDKEIFHEEKAAVFEAGLAYSDYLNADDTGARHKGQNGVCTHIGSPFFSYFESTSSKSRINFLEILRGRHKDYVLSEEALLYAFEQGVTEKTQEILDDYADKRFKDAESWERFLKRKGITSEKDIRVSTEAALFGSAVAHGLRPDMNLITDAAGQFNILIHSLCWIHEERHYRKFIALTEEEKVLIASMRDGIWEVYKALKKHKAAPTKESKKSIVERFDSLFGRETTSVAINQLLANSKSRREGLLKVLDYPWVPLHNNDSERDIREYVKRRKISGSTRSDIGRKARDTFTSLKKTCVKLNVCFWGYLRDRIGGYRQIKPLAQLVAEKARACHS